MKTAFTALLLLILLPAAPIIARDRTDADSVLKSIPDSVTLAPAVFARYLRQHCTTDEEIARVVYTWLAKSIYYDLDMLEASPTEEPLDRIVTETLRTRRGVCCNYAETFTAILTAAGIKTVTVHGYTKSDGKIDTLFGHAWNAALIDGKWQLFDATWGGGFVRYERFHRRFSMAWYMPRPDTLVRDHMPFDPVWQLIEDPIDHSEFFNGRATRDPRQFNFNDSINACLAQSDFLGARNRLARELRYGITYPSLVKLRDAEFLYLLQVQESSCIDRYNNAVSGLSKLIDGKSRGKQGKPIGKKEIDALSQEIRHCKADIRDLTERDPSFTTTGKGLLTNLSKMEETVKSLQRSLPARP